MCRGVKTNILNRALENKHSYKKVFPGATAADLNYYCVRTLEKDRPDISIIHGGTNRIGKDDAFEIAEEIVETVRTCKSYGCNKVFVSGIINRPDHSEEVVKLNKILYNWQFLHNFTFIFNENIHSDCLAWDKHHLNVKGSLRLTSNFRRALNKPYV